MAFTGNIAPEEVIEVLQEKLMQEKVIGAKGRPIVLGRSILEPIDEEARIRASEGRETVRTAADQWVRKSIKRATAIADGTEAMEVDRLQTARDVCGDGGTTYTSHNPKIAWKRFPILYYLDVANSPAVVVDKVLVESPLDKAFNEYNVAFRTIRNSTTALMFKRTMDPVLAKVMVRWQYLDGALKNLGRCYYSWWTAAAAAAAATTTTTTTTTYPVVGEMKSASVNFDTADKWFISSVERCGYSGLYFDIQNIATHEIGHACGLAHNTVDPYSTMYPTSKAGETLRRTLGKADIAALTALYK